MVDRKQYKIAVAGLSYAGKTSILKRLLTGEFIPTEPTHGFDTEGFERSNVRFLALDLGGQETFIQTLLRSFIPQAECLVFVVDTSDQGNFQRARDVLLFSISWNPKIKALLVLANKQDLPQASTVEETLEQLNLPTVLAENNIKNFRIFGTSAKNGEGVEEAFSWLAKQLITVESAPTANIHGVHIFKKVDQPVRPNQSIAEELIGFHVTTTGKNVLLTPDAGKKLKISAEEVFREKYNTLELQTPAGQKCKVINAVKSGLCSLLVVDTTDDSVTVEAIGNEILDYASQQDKNGLFLAEKNIVHILHPFLVKKDIKESTENFEELKANLPARKTVLETVSEINERYTQYGYEREGSGFFTKMSVMDRIRAIEKRKNTRL
ncbi:MAG: ADP-ribosylation factor-like protein [Candidatus Odinarchaeota archaeon]